MVMNLPMPKFDSIQLIRDVVAERAPGVNADFFNNILVEWCERVQQYIDFGGSPPTVARWNAVESRKNTLLNLYMSPAEGSAQAKMLAAMRGHELSVCPACGEPGRPNTLDHYLPKALYPHLCITPVNLFPVCDACQLAKGTKVGDTGAPRFFIHPYFDAFAAEHILRLEIRPPFTVPRFSFGPIAGLDVAIVSLVCSHIRELAIEQRFTSYFRNQYRRLLRLASRIRAANQDVLASLTVFADAASEPSMNTWEYVFYEAVIVNEDLIQFLSSAVLPDHL